jgi:hypothetical protein
LTPGKAMKAVATACQETIDTMIEAEDEAIRVQTPGGVFTVRWDERGSATALVSRQARNVGLSRRTQAAAQGANHSDTQRYREDLQRSDGACGQARERHFWLDATLGVCRALKASER